MEVFQSIKILTSGDRAKELKSALIEKGGSMGWVNRPHFEEDYKRNVMFGGVVLVVESPELFLANKMLKANLWMRTDHGTFILFNIIPIKTRQLSYAEYNYILTEYFNSVIKPVTKNLGIDSIISGPERLMQDIIGNDVYNLLNRFSKNANKTTGNTHPLDFDRWSDFVIAIYRNEIQLTSEELVRWLEEDENWDNTMAWKLGLDYEYALAILAKYEQS